METIFIDLQDLFALTLGYVLEVGLILLVVSALAIGLFSIVIGSIRERG